MLWRCGRCPARTCASLPPEIPPSWILTFRSHLEALQVELCLAAQRGVARLGGVVEQDEFEVIQGEAVRLGHEQLPRRVVHLRTNTYEPGELSRALRAALRGALSERERERERERRAAWGQCIPGLRAYAMVAWESCVGAVGFRRDREELHRFASPTSSATRRSHITHTHYASIFVTTCLDSTSDGYGAAPRWQMCSSASYTTANTALPHLPTRAAGDEPPQIDEVRRINSPGIGPG